MPINNSRLLALFKNRSYTVTDSEVYNIRGKKLKGSVSRAGYVNLCLTDLQGEFNILKHQVVWIFYHGTYTRPYQINHKDGSKENNHITNLELVTPKENIKHSNLNNLRGNWSGTRWWRSKLNKKQLLQLFLLRERGFSQAKLAKIFAMNPSNISRILNRKRYAKEVACVQY